MSIGYEWRGLFASVEVNGLHAEGFGHDVRDDDWVGRLERHSLGWVCARDRDELIGFVNVAWDGNVHAFVLDTVVSRRLRRRGVGTALVNEAVRRTRDAGCAWIHVDLDARMRSFYLGACGSATAEAGVIVLTVTPTR